MIAVKVSESISAEQFWEIVHRPENEGRRLELVQGVIVEEMGLNDMAGGTGGKHGEVVGRLTVRAGSFIENNRLGRYTGAETCFVLHTDSNGEETIRCPDFAYISFARAPQPLEDEFVPFAPDLAVEIISPGNSAAHMHDKVLDYLRYGTLQVWVFYPESRTAVVHTKDGAITYMPDDVLDGGDVLPGFTLTVREVFGE
jgi:Uma2 family endonuclease